MTAGGARAWDIDERAAFLATTRLFAEVPARALTEVGDRLRIKHVARGRFVFHEGEPAGALHILASGRVKIVRETEDGREVILRVIGPGDIFGGSGGWGESVYPATAIATERATVFQLPVPDFAALIDSTPAVARAVVHELGARLREAEARIRELQTERVEQGWHGWSGAGACRGAALTIIAAG